MKYEIITGGKTVAVEIHTNNGALTINSVAGISRFEAVEIQTGVYSVLMDNQSFVVGVCTAVEQRVNINGAPQVVELLDEVHLHLRELGWNVREDIKAGVVSAQIPGLITKIFYQLGDSVTEGDPLFLMEAMKMENEIKAPVSGIVQKISIKAGQTVEKGTNIIEIG